MLIVIIWSYTLIVGVLKYFLIFHGFVLFDSDPFRLSSYGVFVHFCFSLSSHVIVRRDCWLWTLVSCDHGIVHLDYWSIKIFSHFWGFCPLWFWSFGLSSYGAFVEFCFSLSSHVITWWECWLSTSVSCVHGIIHIDCWSIKIFSHFWGFVLFDSDPYGFRPMVLLSIFAFLCPPTWSHDENIDCPHLNHVIMGSYTLIVGVLKYFLIFSGFVLFDSDLLGFRPMVLLSNFAFLCPPTWSHDENVDCPHLYHVFMGSYTLIVGVLKYFLILGGFVLFDSDPYGFCPLVLLSIFAFLCPPTWSHDENIDCPHLNHVIMGSYTLIVGVLKYFLIFGVLSSLILIFWSFRPMVLLSNFTFPLFSYVIAWRECWLSTPVSCDHGIVHLDCWSINMFSHFWSFCPLWFWSFFVFRPVVLLSIFAFLCLQTWLHNENVDCPHLYHVIMGLYTLIVGVLKYFLTFTWFVRFDSDPLGLSSYGAFV